MIKLRGCQQPSVQMIHPIITGLPVRKCYLRFFLHIQHIDLVGFAIRDMNEGWDIAMQIQKRMQFERCLGRTKRCPWKQGQAQVYGRRIQCVDCVVQIDIKAPSEWCWLMI